MKRIQNIVEEAAKQVAGLRAAFIGDRDGGLVIAAVNVGEINIHAVAAYTTELVRANMKFSKAIGSASGVESLWSLTASERFYVRMIPETDCYIAFVVSRSAPFYSFLPGLEKILQESKSVLPKALAQKLQVK
jgi:predicted regulator of Ras-like GTPase activity (Roadblock/LC7/MglB family)